MNNNQQLRNLENFLKKKIFPDLELGRVNWDKPHTIAVVKKLKLIIRKSPFLKLDKLVLIVAAYTHDWGYYVFYKKGILTHNNIQPNIKTLHMIEGAKLAETLLTHEMFNHLATSQKNRIIHLVQTHDHLNLLNDMDELVLMEADTLGALDVNLVKPTFNKRQNKTYLDAVVKYRYPLFITKTGKKEFKRLFIMRTKYYSIR